MGVQLWAGPAPLRLQGESLPGLSELVESPTCLGSRPLPPSSQPEGSVFPSLLPLVRTLRLSCARGIVSPSPGQLTNLNSTLLCKVH